MPGWKACAMFAAPSFTNVSVVHVPVASWLAGWCHVYNVAVRALIHAWQSEAKKTNRVSWQGGTHAHKLSYS
jgi:hypothetical protein